MKSCINYFHKYEISANPKCIFFRMLWKLCCFHLLGVCDPMQYEPYLCMSNTVGFLKLCLWNALISVISHFLCDLLDLPKFPFSWEYFSKLPKSIQAPVEDTTLNKQKWNSWWHDLWTFAIAEIACSHTRSQTGHICFNNCVF